uniref:Uncharacterized protein n=1 Tax=Anopheles quadriannulatus TaxID=34691 RepID=A0A182XPH1_ANOQN
MIWACRRCLRLYDALYMIRQFSSILEQHPPGAVRRRIGLYQHNTLETQPAPGAPIAPSDGVERARSQRSGQEFNPSDHYPLPHNSCSSNRTEPTALLIAVKY